MHIPPYYKKRGWQRFFAGIIIGSFVAYMVFVYMHGHLYEQLLKENRDLKSNVTELENQKEALLKDKDNLDEKANRALTIEAIEVAIINKKDMEDSLIVQDFEALIKEQINHIIGKKISIISESDNLLIATIENKPFTIDDFSYQFIVKKLVINKTVKLEVEAKLTN